MCELLSEIYRFDEYAANQEDKRMNPDASCNAVTVLTEELARPSDIFVPQVDMNTIITRIEKHS